MDGRAPSMSGCHGYHTPIAFGKILAKVFWAALICVAGCRFATAELPGFASSHITDKRTDSFNRDEQNSRSQDNTARGLTDDVRMAASMSVKDHVDNGESVSGTRRRPRILTVLTTYNRRSAYVKPYKEAVSSRADGYRPTIFVTSDQEDDNIYHVIDYQSGSPRRHRLLAALREALRRYEGTFDWVAIGDDDTVFMYNRLRAFLAHIDHNEPVVLGRVDGLNPNAAACRNRKCFSPEQKRNTSDSMAQQGCCNDFVHRCEVPVFPLNPEVGYEYHYADYGPGGLFWSYGGSGTLLSAGLAENVVGGTEGWAHCAFLFGIANTDVQLAQCLKIHGYTMGSYRQGFIEMETADPTEIREALAKDCQLMGVHLGIRHLADGGNYTEALFHDAVAAVRDEDEAWTGDGDDLESSCPETWEAISQWKHEQR